MVLGLSWKFFSRGDFKVIISNYSSSPNGLASWVIDSEAMRARGIIVLEKSN